MCVYGGPHTRRTRTRTSGIEVGDGRRRFSRGRKLDL